MKGILKTGVDISENEMLAIGTEVEITNGWGGCGGYFYQCEIPGGKQVVINSEKIEITDHRPYVNWEQRRYELAKSAMQGYCIAFGLNDDSETYENIAIGSLRVANAMIKKMKGG